MFSQFMSFFQYFVNSNDIITTKFVSSWVLVLVAAPKLWLVQDSVFRDFLLAKRRCWWMFSEPSTAVFADSSAFDPSGAANIVMGGCDGAAKYIHPRCLFVRRTLSVLLYKDIQAMLNTFVCLSEECIWKEGLKPWWEAVLLSTLMDSWLTGKEVVGGGLLWLLACLNACKKKDFFVCLFQWLREALGGKNLLLFGKSSNGLDTPPPPSIFGILWGALLKTIF